MHYTLWCALAIHFAPMPARINAHKSARNKTLHLHFVKAPKRLLQDVAFGHRVKAL
jgi:hypothetical protein